MRRIGLAILMLLGACASDVKDLTVTSATPASVTVWGKDHVSEQALTDEASKRCAADGKVARRTYEQHYALSRTITFDCVSE